MKQETYLKKFGTPMIAAAMILVTLLSGLFVSNSYFEEVSAGGGDFAGGDGTTGSPYQIEDVQDLQNMSANPSANYVIINDIDASDTQNWNDGKGFEPVGDYYNKFTGNLEAQGYRITRLFINRTSNYVGLFGCVGAGGHVLNISMMDVTISGNDDVGGFVGWNVNGTVQDCSANGNICGRMYVGGLVGNNDGGTVQNCYTTGNVSGIHHVGGLVGYNDGDTVENCSATSKVIDGKKVGGLVGINSDTVENCYATGDVSGTYHVGGLVGCNCGTVRNCYSTGTVSGNSSFVGGLVGWNYEGTVKNSFWDMDTSGQHTSEWWIGKHTSDMIKKSTFTDAGWDFINIWGIFEGEGYPYLKAIDMDGDGIPNSSDAFPDDPAASMDTDWDGYPDEWNPGKTEEDSTTGLHLDAFPDDPNKWEEKDNKSFLSQKIGPLTVYTYLAFVIIGIAVGTCVLKMKGGKSVSEPKKPEQSQ